jgi:diacylglycerol kinase (ATP)
MSLEVPTVTVVVNPTAGRGRAGRLLPSVLRELLIGMPGASLRVHQATSYEEARLRCIDAVESARPGVYGGRRDSLVVMGGDGMMHLGLNAAGGTSVPLGLIPAGTGNDFCRGVGVPTKAIPATRVITGGKTLRMDLTLIEGMLAGGATRRYVGSVMGTGYDSKVNRRANAMTMALGSVIYAYAALAELSTFEPLRYRMTLDGVPRNQTAMMVAVANCGIFGGGMKIAPDYSITDGLLDVTIIHPVSRATLLRLLPTMFDGSFVKDPAVERVRVQRITVDGDDLYGMADGEALGPVPLTCTVQPAALTVYVP